MASPRRLGGLLLAAAALLVAGRPARAIMIFPDPGREVLAFPAATAAPGYQYEGEFGQFMGTAIAPQYFITVAHLPGVAVGDSFTLSDGSTHVTDSVSFSGDVAIWHVQTAFAQYAAVDIEPAASNLGQDFVAYGRGVARGDPIAIASGPDAGFKGWQWGAYDGAVSTGTGTIDSNPTIPGYGPTLSWTFNQASSQLANFDSGGGLFIKKNGAYVLAGINDLVDPEPVSTTGPNGPFVNAAVIHQNGLYTLDDAGNPVLLTDPNGGHSYDIQVSASLGFILQTTGVPEPSGLVSMVAGGAGVGLAYRRRRRRGPGTPA